MFERFTTDARAIVTQAQVEARRRDDHVIGTQHVLLAMARVDGPTRRLLGSFGLFADAIDAELDRLIGSHERPLDGHDAAALAQLGIDLDRVRDAVEQTFGEGALARAALDLEQDRRRSRWGHVLRRRHRAHRARQARRVGPGALGGTGRGGSGDNGGRGPSSGHRPSASGHLPFNPRCKKVLELSLREALRLKQKHIAAEHLALGILREGEGMACQVIVARGVTLGDLRAALEAQVLDAA
jgi:ATP-dependent Clp protease ATP-binding subunit ClpA